MIHRFRAALCGLVLSWLTVIGAASAQDLRALTDQIQRLQRDVDVLQRRLASGGGAAAAPAAPGAAAPAAVQEGFAGQIDQRLATLEGQAREQTGRVEEVQFKLRQIEGRLDKLLQDVEFRFQQLERGAPGQSAAPPASAAPAAAAPMTPPPALAAPAAPAAPSAAGVAAPAATAPSAAPSAAAGAVPPGQQRFVLVPSGTSAQALQQQQAGVAAPAATATGAGMAAAAPAAAAAAAIAPEAVRLPAGAPEAQYEYAYGLLVQAQRGTAEFASAEQAMKLFVAQNGAHRLAGDAQYWYGETLYARQDWQGAALAFGEGLKRYPNTERAPHNMLGFGRALARLNRKQDACAAFADLAKRHPNAPKDVKDALQLERRRNGC